MAWTPELDELVQQTVVVKSLSSFDGYGDPTYSTAGSTYQARVTWQPFRVTDWSGDERVAQAQIIIATTVEIKATDQITLPNGETPEILHIREIPWVDGLTHHVAVSVGGRAERQWS